MPFLEKKKSILAKPAIRPFFLNTVTYVDSTGTTHQPPLFYEESFFSNHLRVIILADLAHGNHGTGVLVGSGGVQIMEGGGVSGVLVATGKVHTHREVDLTSSHDEVKECVQLVILQITVEEKGKGKRENKHTSI